VAPPTGPDDELAGRIRFPRKITGAEPPVKNEGKLRDDHIYKTFPAC
jgi:hypothetical protein